MEFYFDLVVKQKPIEVYFDLDREESEDYR